MARLSSKDGITASAADVARKGGNQWKLIGDFPVAAYKCGLKAGDKLRLTHRLEISYKSGKLTGVSYRKGSIWHVTRGTNVKPLVVWMINPDREMHTWNDDPSIFEHFEVIDAVRTPRKTKKGKLS